MGVELDNTCTVSRMWNVSRVISEIYRWVNNTLRLSLLVVEHSVMVMTAGSQSRRSQIDSQFSISVLWNLCSESVWSKILRPNCGLQPLPLPLGWNTYLLFNPDIVNFVWSVNFCSLWGGGVRLKVLFTASWNRIFFKPGFSQSNKHDTFWHVVSTGYISTFYFYEPLLFQIFVPWKLMKTYTFSCLLALL